MPIEKQKAESFAFEPPQVAAPSTQDVWITFACAALTGLLARPNTDKYDTHHFVGAASVYADAMEQKFRERVK